MVLSLDEPERLVERGVRRFPVADGVVGRSEVEKHGQQEAGVVPGPRERDGFGEHADRVGHAPRRPAADADLRQRVQLLLRVAELVPHPARLGQQVEAVNARVR